MRSWCPFAAPHGEFVMGHLLKEYWLKGCLGCFIPPPAQASWASVKVSLTYMVHSCLAPPAPPTPAAAEGVPAGPAHSGLPAPPSQTSGLTGSQPDPGAQNSPDSPFTPSGLLGPRQAALPGTPGESHGSQRTFTSPLESSKL